MNKVDLAQQIAEALGVSKSQAEQMVNVLLDTIMSAVKRDDSVVLTGFGTFSKGKRAARTGRNPQTGASIQIAAMSVPKFKAGKAFKDALR
jgi:DNA-binding protein HU-beta